MDDDAAAGRAALIDASRHVREAAAELAAVLHQLEDVVDEAVVALEAGGSASESYRASGFNAVRDDLFAVQAKFDEAFTMVRACAWPSTRRVRRSPRSPASSAAPASS